MKASDVSDEQFLTIVRGINPRWASRWDVEELLPDVPAKVLLAKARSLIRRGLMTGCYCGCRGDWEVVT